MGLIYLIQPAELIGTHRYKIGCSTKTNLDRIRNYKKGSRCICICKCDNPYYFEKILKKLFNDKFELIAGREYFEGNNELVVRNFFMKIFHDILDKKIIFEDLNETIVKNNYSKKIIETDEFDHFVSLEPISKEQLCVLGRYESREHYLRWQKSRILNTFGNDVRITKKNWRKLLKPKVQFGYLQYLQMVEAMKNDCVEEECIIEMQNIHAQDSKEKDSVALINDRDYFTQLLITLKVAQSLGFKGLVQSGTVPDAHTLMANWVKNCGWIAEKEYVIHQLQQTRCKKRIFGHISEWTTQRVVKFFNGMLEGCFLKVARDAHRTTVDGKQEWTFTNYRLVPLLSSEWE